MPLIVCTLGRVEPGSFVAFGASLVRLRWDANPHTQTERSLLSCSGLLALYRERI